MNFAADKSFRVDLQYSYELNFMFDLVCRSAAMCGFSVDNVDRFNYMINLSKGMSLWTWGENINIAMGILPDGRTGITIVSSPNLGTEIGSRKQNQKNVETLINMINSNLNQNFR